MKIHITVYKIVLSLILIAITFCSNSQNIGTSIGSLNSCPGTIIVPIKVSNCYHIGGVSLVLNYNSNILTYNTYQDANPQLSNGTLSVNSYNGKIIISWASINSLNISQDTLLNLNFTASTGSSSLSWDVLTPGNCEYSDSLGNIIQSTYSDGSVLIYKQPVINSNPINSTITEGQNTSFSVYADGTNLSYQWQVNNTIGISGGSWSNLSNNSIYSNVNGNILYITSTLLNMNNNQYRCIVSGTCSPTAVSNAATLTVNIFTPPPPTIIVSVGSSAICPGHVIIPVTIQNFINIASFSLALSYNPSSLTFIGLMDTNNALATGTFSSNTNNGKIYMTWAALSGVTINNTNDTLALLVFNGNLGNNNLIWDVQTPGNAEFAFSNGTIIPSSYANGAINFNDLAVINTDPVNATILENQSTSFTVNATGTSLNYQWQVSTDNGGSWNNLYYTNIYSNVYSPTLYLSNVPISMSGYKYRCIVSGACPPFKTSNSAVLTVNPIPQLITMTVSNQSICPGLLVVPVSTNNFTKVSSFSFVIKYDKNVLSFVNAQNINPAVSGTIYINNTPGSIYLSWASTSNISITGNLLELKFNAVTGTSFLNWDVQTAGNCEITDSLAHIISTTYNNSSITVYQPPQITSQPVSITVNEGQPSSFNIGVTGSGISYQWQIFNSYNSTWSNFTNATSLYLAYTSYGYNGREFRCIVSGYCNPSDTSNTVTLNVIPLPQQATVIAHNTNLNCVGIQTISGINLNNIGSFSFTLIYDTTKLLFEDLQIVNPFIQASDIFVNNVGNKIFITWATTAPVYFGDSTLFNLLFISHGGTSTNVWDVQTPGNCEVSDGDGNILNTTFVNGTVTASTCYQKVLNLKVFLEGFYNSGNLIKSQDENGDKFTGDISDIITLNLYSAQSPDVLAYTDPNVSIHTNGNIFLLLPYSYSDSYYLALVHRNHIETWSAIPVSFANDFIKYNFTDNAGKAFSDNQKEMEPGKFALYAGDCIQDGIINIFDLADIFDMMNDPYAPNGYLSEDINGDSVVNIFDLAFVFDNMNLGVGSMTPLNMKK